MPSWWLLKRKCWLMIKKSMWIWSVQVMLCSVEWQDQQVCVSWFLPLRLRFTHNCCSLCVPSSFLLLAFVCGVRCEEEQPLWDKCSPVRYCQQRNIVQLYVLSEKLTCWSNKGRLCCAVSCLQNENLFT